MDKASPLAVIEGSYCVVVLVWGRFLLLLGRSTESDATGHVGSAVATTKEFTTNT